MNDLYKKSRNFERLCIDMTWIGNNCFGGAHILFAKNVFWGSFKSTFLNKIFHVDFVKSVQSKVCRHLIPNILVPNLPELKQSRLTMAGESQKWSFWWLWFRARFPLISAKKSAIKKLKWKFLFKNKEIFFWQLF